MNASPPSAEHAARNASAAGLGCLVRYLLLTD
jgi:hypothetical protein